MTEWEEYWAQLVEANTVTFYDWETAGICCENFYKYTLPKTGFGNLPLVLKKIIVKGVDKEDWVAIKFCPWCGKSL